jgi:hypothetical protein
VEERVEHPTAEHIQIELGLLLRQLVQLGKVEHGAGATRPIEQAESHGRRGGEQHIVETDKPALEDDLTRVAVGEGKPELDDVQANVLVERVEDDLAEAFVVPGAVHEQELGQEAELTDGVVRGGEGLCALASIHSHAHVSRLDHGDVVGSVAYGQSNRARLCLDKLHKLGLVLGRGSTADNRAACRRYAQELLGTIQR